MSKSITLDTFDEFFTLDYAQSLMLSVVDEITEDSPLVDKLQQWCKDQNYIVGRDVCCDVLNSIITG